jgi:nitroreductase
MPKKPSTLVNQVMPLISVRQIRNFMKKPVTAAELDAIARVIRWGGTSRNEQPLRYVIVRDRPLIEEIAEVGLPQTRGLPTASAIIAIIEPDEEERRVSRAFDDGRAVERIMAAANMLGLGSGMSRVRAERRPAIDKLLGIPAGRSVRTIVGIGHPSKEGLERKSRPGQARLPLEEVVYQERWPAPAEE